MKVALAQVNPLVGDLEGNVARCLAAAKTAEGQGADLLLLPELALTGSPPRDILYDESFIEAAGEAVLDLARRMRGSPPALVGSVYRADCQIGLHPGLLNAALLLEGGKVRLAGAKRLLRSWDVFHESRWFLPGAPCPLVQLGEAQVGVVFDADLDDRAADAHPATELVGAGANLLVCLAASPFHQGVMKERLLRAKRTCCRLVYANLCGGNDELIYDGRSFWIDAAGNVGAQLALGQEETRVLELDGAEGAGVEHLEPENELFKILVLGVRDFFSKNHLERAFLGVSGGVDSALAAVIARSALGCERVTGISLPSRYTDPRSVESARDLCQRLGIGFELVELDPLHRAAEGVLGDLLNEGSGSENIQARLRTLVLMSFVNRFGGTMLNTSNKTELSVGYITLYGDTAGTLCPLGDLTKLEVLRLARWINREHEWIPAFILNRPPTAELRPNQEDPFDYEKIVPELERLVQSNQSNEALARSEYKRWQMGVILRVSQKAFGSGRLIPITRR